MADGSTADESEPQKPEFHKLCRLDDMWAGDTQIFTVAGTKVLVVHTDDGSLTAVQAMCPHQSVSLADAKLNGRVLTCPMHLWEMDVVSGKGVNPKHAELAMYPIQLKNGCVYVSVAGIRPKFSRP